MKRFTLAILFSIVFATSVLAAPFLVCTVDPDAETYVIRVGGTNTVETPAPLHFDLGQLSNGQHNLEVAAKNVWGQSTFVPFGFNKAVPGTPSDIGLSAE